MNIKNFGWISVNDRLPNDEDYGWSEDVLVRFRYNCPETGIGDWDVGESRYDPVDEPVWNNGWCFGSCDYAEVSHWMPKSELLGMID